MNIFKILANGHGNVSETNVSAFLGYLLDPNEDHGLKDEFLKQLLDLIFDSKEKLEPLFNMKIKQNQASFKDLVINKDIKIDVLFEKAFEGSIESNDVLIKELFNKDKEKQIVDIVILISRKLSQADIEDDNTNKIVFSKSKQNTFVTEFLPVAAVLIENKIDVKPTPGQILKQAIYTHAKINSEVEFASLKEVYSIYLTPSGSDYAKEWKTCKNDNNSFHYTLHTQDENKDLNFKLQGEHVLWSGKNKDSSIDENISQLLEKFPKLPETTATKQPNIYEILSEIIRLENEGSIDPINDLSKHTIKSFMNFISSDFSCNSSSSIFSNNMHDCSRFEFYKHCLQENIRSNVEISNLFEIEKEIMIVESQCEVNYTIGNNPMMTFKNPNENFFLRIELWKKEYRLVGFDPRKETIGSLNYKSRYNGRPNTLFFTAEISKLFTSEVLEFINLGAFVKK